MRFPIVIPALAIATALAGCTGPASPGGAPAGQALPSEALEAVPMVNHIQFGVFEQDIYLERPGEEGVFRVTPADAASPAARTGPIFASATSNPHDVSFQHAGPFAKGDALPFTLEQWLAARGAAAYLCTAGAQARLDASFTGLVPLGLYTFWDAKLTLVEGALTAAVDLPLGAPDGSQASFRADAQGNARFQAAWEGCIEPSTAGPGIGPTGSATAFAIAWHRDDRAHGASPGPFGQLTHLQLFGLVRGARA